MVREMEVGCFYISLCFYSGERERAPENSHSYNWNDASNMNAVYDQDVASDIRALM